MFVPQCVLDSFASRKPNPCCVNIPLAYGHEQPCQINFLPCDSKSKYQAEEARRKNGEKLANWIYENTDWAFAEGVKLQLIKRWERE